MNKQTEVSALFAETNPAMVETSVWTDLDYTIGFPIEPKEGSIYKADLLGVKQLEYVKNAQDNWIEHGTNKHLCVKPFLKHNVSNTITVDDWDEVTKYIFNNRHSLCGISLLSAAGDRAYSQAPFTEVFTHEQIIEMYGEVALFTSALIETGLNAFNQDLWTACSTALGFGEVLTDDHKDLLKRDFVRRFDKFSTHFLNEDEVITINSAAMYVEAHPEQDPTDVVLGNIKHLKSEAHLATSRAKEQCSNCLKDVYNLHKWWKITNTAKPINWATDLSKKEFVDVDTLGSQGCSGGACELTF